MKRKHKRWKTNYYVNFAILLWRFSHLTFHFFFFTRDDRSEIAQDGPAGMDPEGVIESTWHEVYDNFDDMNLREELLRGIYGYGFEKPSAIQQRAIIPCVKGRDVIAQAQSGE